ncbi:hypothetical protein DMA11_19140 [Marinilabiliaceae bacterium JC017]|nr:hypothetical protein DMA11_19140 [Marinilabiliaceae bacterium JC017]
MKFEIEAYYIKLIGVTLVITASCASDGSFDEQIWQELQKSGFIEKSIWLSQEGDKVRSDQSKEIFLFKEIFDVGKVNNKQFPEHGFGNFISADINDLTEKTVKSLLSDSDNWKQQVVAHKWWGSLGDRNDTVDDVHKSVKSTIFGCYFLRQSNQVVSNEALMQLLDDYRRCFSVFISSRATRAGPVFLS